MIQLERVEKPIRGDATGKPVGFRQSFVRTLSLFAASAGTEGHELRGGRVSFVPSRKDAIITPCLTEDCKRRLHAGIYCIFLPLY